MGLSIGKIVPGIALMLLAVPFAVAENRPDVNAAVTASDEWLELFDDSDAAAAWETAAEPFRESIGKTEWTAELAGIHGTAGKKLSRKLMSTVYRTTLRQAPDGDYVVLQYESSFEKLKECIQTVIVVKEDDGVWRTMAHRLKVSSKPDNGADPESDDES